MGAPSTWNGPNTVFSVAPGGRRLLIASTQHREAQRIAEQDELLSLVMTEMAGSGQEADGHRPFLLAQADIPGKSMQMLDQRRHDFGQARINVPPHARVDGWTKICPKCR